MSAVAALINDGRRLHLQHGPIDLIIEVSASADAVQQAYQQAVDRFATVLTELVAELPSLRQPAGSQVSLHGTVALRMQTATARFPRYFTTPMIAVAGAVADEVLQSLRRDLLLPRVLVNNGGDIAIYLGPQQHTDIGVVANPLSGKLAATIRLTPDDGVGGIATSGCHGRSLSLGIADAVTVLAANAATADAAATLIANAVTLPDCAAIERCQARELDADSDLGDREVTVAVGPLSEAQIKAALNAGLAVAEQMKHDGHIVDAHLSLRDYHKTTDSRAYRYLPIQ